MRFWSISLLCSLFVSLSSAISQEVLVVPMMEKSSAGSPFEVVGSILLREAAYANELEWSWGEKLSVKNVSSKPILLFVATLTEIGRHPAPTGRHSAPGNGPTYQLEDDRFFDENLVQPGESLLLRDTTASAPEVACCINPLSEIHDPSAEFRFHFVQFSDGSTFGDSADAQSALEVRGTIEKGLRELIQSYTTRGAPGFVERLKQQSAFSATSIYRRIFSKYTEGGVGEALSETKHMLATAERHAAAIAGTEARPRSSSVERKTALNQHRYEAN